MNITEHFSSREFACRDGTPYPHDLIEEHLRPLCEMLEMIRAAIAQPIRITSGYRTPAHNRFVGGAKDSRHVHGDAADIIARSLSPAELHKVVLDLHDHGMLPKLGGLGIYKGWIHVDTRPCKPGESIARWSGAGVDS